MERPTRLRARTLGWIALSAMLLVLASGCSTVRQWTENLLPGEPAVEDASADSVTTVDVSGYSAEDVLEQAPVWMQQADTAFAAGDSATAEALMMRSILALQAIFLDIPEGGRAVVFDSLTAWSDSYEDRFGAISGDLVATSDGLSSLVTRDDASSADSLAQDLAVDTFEVVLDTTIREESGLPNIPDTTTRKVENVITYFTEKPRGRKAMEVWLDRAGDMIPRMQPILREHGVPEDLVYLAMIESGFRTDAQSYAAAVGPWQFIASTGRIFDLEIDWWYDARQDPELATHAAARYLRQLYEHLGDWYLALAAYNCGEGRVNREIRRSNSRDFWELSRLPRQTRNYVPTYLAARQIAKDPEKYGFKSPVMRTMPPRDTVFVSEAVDMDALADALGVSRSTLKSLNPAIKRWATPPDRENTPLYLPVGVKEGFDEALASVPPSKKTRWVRHRVRSGEALSTIARNYGTSMRAIMDVAENRLSNPHRIRAGQTLLVPVGPSGPSGSSGGTIAQADRPEGSGESRVVVVRRGDTLSEIAERNGVGLSRLLRWNGLSKHSTIHPGQKLMVYGGRAPEPREPVTAVASAADASGRPVYTVRRGDTVSEIADRHGVGLSQVLAWNGLGRRSTIRPGDKLIVGEAGAAVADASSDAEGGNETPAKEAPVPEREVGQAPEPAAATAAAAETGIGPFVVAPEPVPSRIETRGYRVGRGDTLWDIARAHGTTVSELQALNGLSAGSTLRVGDELQVPAPSGEEIVHNVRRGDTLWDIAKQYNVSVRDLKTWNNLRDANDIRPGERLVIRLNGRSGGQG